MVEQACIASLHAKFHVSGMTWADFTHVYLESCTWRFLRWIRERNSECALNCASLRKSATETLEMIQQGFGDQSFSRAQVFQWHARFKTGRTSVDDDERTERPTNCTTPETVARMQELIRQDRVWPFATLLRRWNLVMGHANGFWRKNWACTVSQPICAQDPDSWPEAAARQRLHWTSSARLQRWNVLV